MCAVSKTAKLKPRLGLVGAALLLTVPVHTPVHAFDVNLDLEQTAADQMDISNSPLVFTETPEPNILFLMDDSLSMGRTLLAAGSAATGGQWQAGDIGYEQVFLRPDFAFAGMVAPSYEAVQAWNQHGQVGFAQADTHADLNNIWRARSHIYNPVYYNPNETYEPWLGLDQTGTAYADADPLRAMLNPYLGQAAGNTIDLTAPQLFDTDIKLANGLTATLQHKQHCPLLGPCSNPVDLRYFIPRYYTGLDSNGDGQPDRITIQSGQVLDGRGSRTDCASAPSCTYAEEIQNFANWFSYYRSPDLRAKAVLAEVVMEKQGVRMGMATVHNNRDSLIAISALEEDATTGSRRNLLDSIFAYQANAAGSPLRAAVARAGRYYACKDEGWTETYHAQIGRPNVRSGQNLFGSSGSNGCPVLPEDEGGACQAHYTLLVTDGFNTANPAGALLTETANDIRYTGFPQAPNSLSPSFSPDQPVVNFNDPFALSGTADADGNNTAGTLADVVSQYFDADINSLREGEQVVRFGAVALGFAGSVDAIDGASNPLWPNPNHDSAGFSDAFSLDDLRHATIAGDGSQLNLLNRESVGRSLSNLLDKIATVSGSSATSVALNSNSLSAQTRIYQASFHGPSLTGDVKAFPVDASGQVGAAAWSAYERLSNISADDADDRVIYTTRAEDGIIVSSVKEGIPFRYNQLSPGQRVALNGARALRDMAASGELTEALVQVILQQAQADGDLVEQRLQEALGPAYSTIFPGLCLPTAANNCTGVNPNLRIDVAEPLANNILQAVGRDATDDSEQVLNWLRGSPEQEERNGGLLRDRDSVLGPIYHSRPVYVGQPNFDYPDDFLDPNRSNSNRSLAELQMYLDDNSADFYSGFRSQQAGRKEVLYVGANDGMLHGFLAHDANGSAAQLGQPVVSYVPTMVLPHITDLSHVNYEARSYVDGDITVVDAFGEYPGCQLLDTPRQRCWRSILVGALRGGGQGMYALDVTNPNQFTEDNANKLVLWEYRDRPGSLLGSGGVTVQDTLRNLSDNLLDVGGYTETLVAAFALGNSFIDVTAVMHSLGLGDQADDALEGMADQVDETVNDPLSDPDMGATFGRPQIVRIADDPGQNRTDVADNQPRWAVMFSNGYNNTAVDLGTVENASLAQVAFSATGHASLFINDLVSGEEIRKLDTLVGNFADLTGLLNPGQGLADGVNVSQKVPNGFDPALPTSLNLPIARANGLSSPAPIDIDRDGVVDFVYAGDLFGNVWRFDVRDSDPANWKVSNNGLPVYMATLASGRNQPITTRLEVSLHPLAHLGNQYSGVMIYFGTGQFIQAADNSSVNQSTQTLYGIWDKLDVNEAGSTSAEPLSSLIGWNDLLAQDIFLQRTETLDDGQTVTIRAVTGYPITWRTGSTIEDDTYLGWRLDLDHPDTLANGGERIAADPQLRNGRLNFVTLLPNDAPCSAGVVGGFLMELNPANGGRLNTSPFDFNGDGVFDQNDTIKAVVDPDGNGDEPAVEQNIAVSGRQSSVGNVNQAAILQASDNKELQVTAGDSGKLEVNTTNPDALQRRRATWRQLR